MTAERNAKKIAEAEQFVRDAEKCLSTGSSFLSRMLKGGPDLDSAADYYQKAAVAYRAGRDLEKAKQMYIKSGEVQLKAKYYFHAGKSYEQAGLLVKDTGNLPEGAELLEKAGNMYMENHVVDTAMITYEKAAKFIEPVQPNRAIHLYQKCTNIAEVEDRTKQCAEYLGKIARIQLRQNKLEDARQSLQREIQLLAESEAWQSVNKLVMALVLIELHLGDFVAAQKVLRNASSYAGFAGSEENDTLNKLLQAYDSSEGDIAASLLNGPVFKYLDNDIAKLARNLKVPGRTGGTETNGPASGSQQDDDEDNLL